MEAFLLCAGLGSRLRPLTYYLPKPMLPVGGDYMFRRALFRLRSAGFNSFHFNAHHLSKLFVPVAAQWGKVWEEPELLGVGGTISSFLRTLRVGDWAIFHNCDVWVEEDFYSSFLDEALSYDCVGAMVVAPRKGGRVVVEDGNVLGVTFSKTGWDFVGVSVWKSLGSETFCAMDFASFLMERTRAGRVKAWVYDGEWVDGGTFSGYWKLNLRTQGPRFFTSYPFGSGKGVNAVAVLPLAGKEYSNGIFLREEELYSAKMEG